MKLAAPSLVSFLTGAAATAFVFLALGLSPRDDDGDDERSSRTELVRILEGETYVVPDHRVLTIRTIGNLEGTNGNQVPAAITVNGQRVFAARTAPKTEFLVGISAEEGDRVTVEDVVPNPDQTSVLLGFLTHE